MLSYRIELEQDDGRWSAHEFQSVSDDGAIAHALRVRTSNACELYQAERWLATFDRTPEPNKRKISAANDNGGGNGPLRGTRTPNRWVHARYSIQLSAKRLFSSGL